MESKRKCLLTRVYKFYKGYIYHGKKFTMKHFVRQKYPQMCGLEFIIRDSKERQVRSCQKTKISRSQNYSSWNDYKNDQVTIHPKTTKFDALPDYLHKIIAKILNNKYHMKKVTKAKRQANGCWEYKVWSLVRTYLWSSIHLGWWVIHHAHLLTVMLSAGHLTSSQHNLS